MLSEARKAAPKGREAVAAVIARHDWAKALLPALKGIWTDAMVVGTLSAQAVLAHHGVTEKADAPATLTLGVDWGAWAPGDLEAARQILGSHDALGRLMSMLDTGDEVADSIVVSRMDRLARTLIDGLEKGLAPSAIAGQLKGILADPRWAHMVALTETTRAVSAATLLRYRQNGVDAKEWLTASDQRVCNICAGNEGAGSIPLGTGFPSGVDAPPAHPLCRCSLAPSWLTPAEAAAQGLLPSDQLLGQVGAANRGRIGEIAAEQEAAVQDLFAQIRARAAQIMGPSASEPGEAAAEGAARRAASATPQVREVLAQAKTVHDVEYAFWEETGRIRGVRLKYEDIDFTGSSVQTAREHAEGVLRGLERFPDAKLRSVGTADFRSTSYAEATGPDIRFATRWSSPAARDKYLRTIDEDVASGYHGPPASPVTVAVHEFGHVVDLWSLGRAARPEIQALLEREAAARGVEVGELIRSEISGYAERSADELVAEAFADVVMNGEAASSLSREILDMVEAQYRKGGGRAGIAERVASEPKPAPHSPKPAEGRDLLAGADERALARQIIEDSRAYDHSADAGLSAIAHEQGFDGLPRVVSAEEMDRLYAQGGVRMTRGIHAGSKRNVPRAGERRKTAVEIQDEMREGPAYFGNGNAGSGYTFAVGDYHGQVPVEYSDGTPGSIVRATLAPDAKIASLADLRADYDRMVEAEGWTGFRPRVGWMNPSDEVGMPDVIRVFGDPGRLAAARGYDGFWVTPDHEIVVVNRTKLIVERRPANAAKVTPTKAAPAKKATPAKKAPAAPKPPTTASLAKRVKDAGITVPTGLRRPALEQLVKDLEAGTDAATARARALVTIGDERRATAKLLSDVDFALANKASDRAIATLAADVERALPAEVKARDVLAAALRSGDRDQIRAAMAALEKEAKLRPMPGKAGDVVKLDRKTMQVQGGARLADGADVEVIRPGYTTVIEGQTVRVPPVVAQVSEQTRNRLARVALRERQAFIDARTPAANLLAELDRDLALNQDAAVIREHLNAKIWPGIDPKVVDRLAAAYKRDGVEGLRSEIGKVSTAVKVKPIGKSGQFVKFDPETMQAAGGAPIQAGERVKITYRGSRVTLPNGEVVDVVKPVVVREPLPVKAAPAKKATPAKAPAKRVAAPKAEPAPRAVGELMGQAPSDRDVRDALRFGTPKARAGMTKAQADEIKARAAELGKPLGRIYEGTYGGLRVEVDHAVATSDWASVSGTIRDASGQKVGDFGRRFTVDDEGRVWVKHQVVQLDDDYQGGGFGREFNGHVFDEYRRMGVHAVSLEAEGTGGYVWATQGFGWGGETDHVFRSLRTLVDDIRAGKTASSGMSIPRELLSRPDLKQQLAAADDILARAQRYSRDDPHYPTPYEVSQIGRWQGAGKNDWWVGKQRMMHSAWDGVLIL